MTVTSWTARRTATEVLRPLPLQEVVLVRTAVQTGVEDLARPALGTAALVLLAQVAAG